MYLAAGFLTGHVAGQEWEELVQTRIFDRLGMVDSNFSVARSQEADDFARPYQEKDGQVREMPFRDIASIGPAGSINSTIADMGRWLLLHLNAGRHGEQQVVSAGQIAQMHAPQMVMPDDGRFAEVALPSYGLGWVVKSYRGHTVVQHGGNIDGFSALVTMVPRQQIGVVVLTNLNSAPVPNIIAYHVCDRLLGLEEIPWNERLLRDRDEQRLAGDKGKQKAATDRLPDTEPSHPLAAYDGEFAHPGYGTLTIERDGDGLALRFNAFAGPLRHYHYDVFEHTFELFDDRTLFTFATDARGDVVRVSAPLESSVPEIVFTRRPPATMTETAFLERFVGAYDIMGATLTVALKTPHALQLSLPGQPAEELEPVTGTEFRLKGLSGFGIAFQTDAAGTVTEAVLTQPDGVYTAPKLA